MSLDAAGRAVLVERTLGDPRKDVDHGVIAGNKATSKDKEEQK